MADQKPTVGRPRTEGLDEKILDATVQLVDYDETISVNAIVAESGVSRAAIYRRWPSIRDLKASALNEGRAEINIDLTRPIKEALREMLIERPAQSRGENYSDERLRKRIEMSMADRELQQAYWETHVLPRRADLQHALQVAIDRGEIRSDTDIDAVIDSIHGAFYYQETVRGVSMTDPAALARCEAAFEIIWRGIEA